MCGLKWLKVDAWPQEFAPEILKYFVRPGSLGTIIFRGGASRMRNALPLAGPGLIEPRWFREGTARRTLTPHE